MKVVAIRQFRYGSNEWGLELPGGCRESDKDTWESVARRELLEETGYGADTMTKLLTQLWIDPASCYTPFVPMLARGCRKLQDPKLDAGELIETILLDLDHWIQLIHNGGVLDSRSIAITFLALPILKPSTI